MTDMPIDPNAMLKMVRGKEPLDGLCASRQITPEGCDWLKSALDPFHDLQLDSIKGYPDVSTEPTVVVKVRQAMEVSAPPGLVADTWDCHIALTPIDFAQSPWKSGKRTYIGQALPNGNQTHGPGRNLTTNAGPVQESHRLDGLVVNSVPGSAANGADMTFTPLHMPLSGASGYQCQSITLDDYLDFESTDLGAYRLIYSGFEVVNTTAPLHKQGAVTVYEYGNTYETCQGSMRSSGAIPGDNQDDQYPVTYFRCPPNTVAQAKIMPGAHTWAAADGCYNTAKFQSENPFTALTARNYAVCQNMPNTDGIIASGYGDVTASGLDAGSFFGGCRNIPDKNPTYQSAHFSKMNTTGAYFTGLSKETTLFVTWRVGLERLPSANKPTFLALAQPSASFDPNALVLYNLIANRLPPGVPQGWNDAGDWFKTISNVARKVIPEAYPMVAATQAILTALGRPGMAAGVGLASSALKPAVAAVRNFGIPTPKQQNKGKQKNKQKGRK